MASQNNHVKKVAIVGAGGQIGGHIAKALLENGKHQLTAITRQGSSNEIPDGIEIQKVDYDDQSSLVKALQGQEVLIISMAVTAPEETQGKLIEAAAAAGVPWIIPNVWGGNMDDDSLAQDTLLGFGWRAARDHIAKLGKSSMIAISCGFWYEYSLSRGLAGYAIDIPAKTVVFLDEGTSKFSTSTWPQVGRAVTRLLSLPVQSESDGPSLNDYRDKTCFIESFTTSQKEMFDSVLRVTKDTIDNWTVKHVPSKERWTKGKEELQQHGNMNGFTKMLYSRVLFPNGGGNFRDTPGIQLSNEALMLPQENMDEYTGIAIQMAGSLDQWTMNMLQQMRDVEY